MNQQTNSSCQFVQIVKIDESEGLSIIAEGIKKWQNSIGFSKDNRPIVFLSLVGNHTKLKNLLINELFKYIAKNSQHSRPSAKTANEEHHDEPQNNSSADATCHNEQSKLDYESKSTDSVLRTVRKWLHEFEQLKSQVTGIEKYLKPMQYNAEKILQTFSNNPSIVKTETTAPPVPPRPKLNRDSSQAGLQHKETEERGNVVERSQIPPPSFYSETQTELDDFKNQCKEAGIYAQLYVYDEVIDDLRLGILHVKHPDDNIGINLDVLSTFATYTACAVVNVTDTNSCFAEYLEDKAQFILPKLELSNTVLNVNVINSSEKNYDTSDTDEQHLLIRSEGKNILDNVFKTLIDLIKETGRSTKQDHITVETVNHIFENVVDSINNSNKSLNNCITDFHAINALAGVPLVTYDLLTCDEADKFTMGNLNCAYQVHSKSSYDIAPGLVLKIKESFEDSLRRNNVPENISEISHMFTTCLNTFNWQAYLENPPSSVIENLKKQCTKMMQQELKNVETSIDFYSQNMEEKFQSSLYLSEKELQNEFDEAIRKLSNEGKLDELTLVCCEVIKRQYEKKNNLAWETNIELLPEITQTLIEFYDKAMSDFVHTKLHFRDLHQQMHCLLINELVSTLQRIFPANVVTTAINTIKSDMYKAYSEVHDNSMQTLENKFNVLKTVINRCKKQYDHSMDVLLNKNKSGVKKDILEDLHLKQSAEAINQLKSSIIQEVGTEEPCQIHLNTIRKLIEKSYQSLQNDNNEALGDTYTTTTKKNQGASTNLSVPNRNENAPCSSKLNKKSRPRSEFLENGKPKTLPGLDTDDQPLPRPEQHFPVSDKAGMTDENFMSGHPIFYQLSLQKVYGAIMNVSKIDNLKSKVEKNDLMIHDEVMEVALYKEKLKFKWVCGREIKEIPSNSIVCTWKLEKCLNAENLFKDSVNISSSKVEIAVPFLLAIIFTSIIRKLIKSSGQPTMAMISVPVWFSSVWRQQIMEAAKIAGFRKVKIVNENMVLAFRSLQIDDASTMPQRAIFSENSDRVDISMYKYGEIDPFELRSHIGDIDPLNLHSTADCMEKFRQECSIPKKRHSAGNIVTAFRKQFSSEQKSSPDKLKIKVYCLNDVLQLKLMDCGNSLSSDNVEIVPVNDVVLGLALIQQSYPIHEQKMFIHQEKTHYDIVVYKGNMVQHVAIAKKSEITSNTGFSKEFDCILKNCKPGDYRFVQQNKTRKVQLGMLAISDQLPIDKCNGSLLVRMAMGSDGIIRFKYLWHMQEQSSSSGKQIDAHLFRWDSFSLNEERIELYKNLINGKIKKT